MIATAREDLNPLIHGVDARRHADPGEFTREMARSALRDQRRLVADLVAMGGRLREAERAHVETLPDESGRECPPADATRPVPLPPPDLPDAPAPLDGAADPRAVPPELVPWLRRGRKTEASLFATICHQAGRGHWFVAVPRFARAPGEPSRFGTFRTELEAVRAAVARFGPTPPTPIAKRTAGGTGRTPAAGPAGERAGSARAWMLLRREMLGLPAIVR